MTNCKSVDLLMLGDESIGNLRVGEKRPLPVMEACMSKRVKVDEGTMPSDASNQLEQMYSHVVACEREEDYANYMHTSLLSFVELLKYPAINPDSIRPDVALTALSMLCIAFCKYPETDMAFRIFQQMYAWIPWILQQVFRLLIVGVCVCSFLPFFFFFFICFFSPLKKTLSFSPSVTLIHVFT